MLRKLTLVTALAAGLAFPAAALAHGWGGHGHGHGHWHGGGWGHGPYWGGWGHGRYWGGHWRPYGSPSCWRRGFAGWVWVCG